MKLRQLIDYAAYLAVRILICVLQSLPLETCAGIAEMLAWLAHRVLRVRRKVTDENLRIAFPDWNQTQRDQVCHDMWRHLLLLLVEFAHASRKIHDSNWHRYVKIRNIEPLVHALLSDRPVVCVSGHFGNFEVGGVICAQLGYPTYTVARTLDNPWLERFIKRHRESTGQVILPKKGSSYDVDQVLKNGGTLMLLGDQSAGAKGCWVDFFGRLASCHKSVALFSLSENAPMCVSYTKRDGQPLHFEMGVVGVFDPETDADRTCAELTQWYSDLLEQMISESPDQYWWLHRRWRTPPPRIAKKRKQQKQAYIQAKSA